MPSSAGAGSDHHRGSSGYIPASQSAQPAQPPPTTIEPRRIDVRNDMSRMDNPRMDVRVDNRMNDRMEGRMDTRMDSRMDTRMDTRADTRIDTRMDTGRMESSRMDPPRMEDRMHPQHSSYHHPPPSVHHPQPSLQHAPPTPVSSAPTPIPISSSSTIAGATTAKNVRGRDSPVSHPGPPRLSHPPQHVHPPGGPPPAHTTMTSPPMSAMPPAPLPPGSLDFYKVCVLFPISVWMYGLTDSHIDATMTFWNLGIP